MKYTGIYILLTVLLLLAACTGKLTEGKVVTVTIETQRFFAERIAGDKFVVHCVVPSGQSPETYDPTPKQMVQIGQSEAYLQIGYIGFEQVWMQKIRENNPDLKIFDVSKGMQFVKETEEGEHRPAAHVCHSLRYEWNRRTSGVRINGRNRFCPLVHCVNRPYKVRLPRRKGYFCRYGK